MKEGDKVRVKLIDIDPKPENSNFPVRCCCLNRKVWSKMIVKIAASAKIEANVKIADPDKIVEIVLIVTGGRDRKEKKIKNKVKEGNALFFVYNMIFSLSLSIV